MPLWKCTKCHHEWEGDAKRSFCDWCKEEGTIIAEYTEFEDFVKGLGELIKEVNKSINEEDKHVRTRRKVFKSKSIC
jgi:uncharacterized protein YukE